MEIVPPKRKRNCKLPKPRSLPVNQKGSYKFEGIFDGFSVIIKDADQMREIVANGQFGKANLSRSYPQFDGTLDKPEIIRERQFQTRKGNVESYSLKHSKKVLIVPDSDEEDETYFANLQARFEIDKCGNKETVNLMLEEAFFLKNALECLIIYHENTPLEDLTCWTLFSESDSKFPLKYAVYYHFRSKNWVVKPGIKFGGDFLLYKEGPPFYHASYVVSIHNTDLNTTKLMGLHRICETAGKELLICQVSHENEINFNDLPAVSIKEILMKRWISSQEREDKLH